MSLGIHAPTDPRSKRKVRIRKKIFGTAERPRLNVFRSAKHVYAQIVDDIAGKTLAAASTMSKDLKSNLSGKKLDKAAKVGQAIAAACKKKNIDQVVFDRNGFRYHGRIKAVADAAREGGLKF